MQRPLRRHPALQPLSREHHQILLLGFKIRQGLKHKVAPQRIVNYCSWFFHSYLNPHFEKEEKCIGSLFDKETQLSSELKSSHQNVAKKFQNLIPEISYIKSLERLIVSHIRFEERVLFEHLQSHLTTEDITYLELHLKEKTFKENYEDVFWK